ncbi:Twinfilin-1 [Allomyces arbusculus]|nr:Twinfilin-1 [Allomyces arbusculus]
MVQRFNITAIDGDFGDADAVRLYRIDLDKETLALTQTVFKTDGADFAADFDTALSAVTVPDDHPAFFLIQTDTRNEFILLNYVPDASPVSLKMQAALAQPTVKHLLARFSVIDALHITTREELSYAGYEAHVRSKSANAMSADELRLQELDRAVAAEMPRALPGMAAPDRKFTGSVASLVPMEEDVRPAIDRLAAGEARHVILSTNNELVSHVATVAADDTTKLAELVPGSTPSYTITRYLLASAPKYEFVYCCPDGSRVKDRMVTSMMKRALVHYLKNEVHLDVVHAHEISDLDDFADLEADWAHAAEAEPAPAEGEADAQLAAAGSSHAANTFKKPRRPGRPGATRVLPHPE